MNTQKIFQTDHKQSRMRTCIRLSLLALLLATGMFAPGLARAAPNEEKLTLDGAGTQTNAPMAAAAYAPLGLLLVANHDSDTVSVFEMPVLGPVLDSMGDPLTLSVVDQPVAIAIWDDTSVMQSTPTVAYAFVAGYGDSAISVIDLFAEPPVVLTDREIDLTLDEDINTPGPTALAVMGDELFVATNGDGTVMRYDITDLPGMTPAHVDFPVDTTDRTSNAGNAIACTATATVSPAGAKPRSLTVFEGFLWAGCTDGSVSQISPSDGAVTRIYDNTGGPSQAAALAGDPRGNEILYVLDDDATGERGIYALDFTGGTLADPPYIENICDQGNAPRRSIPIPSGNATAMVPYDDPSDTTNWLVVLSTSSTGSNLTLVNVASIDPEGDVPECTLDAEDGISFTVPLTLGDPVFSTTTTPNDLSQQIGVYGSYIAVPNYRASGGADMVSLVTDAALLEEAGPAVLAFGYNDGDAMTVEDNNVKTQVDMVFTTDE
ncbi:MAG: hypothetical protein KDH09_14740, partial [Chrysiogenetes bacterium]|nr:hypothetical protein [Chrysiogenetes bacterium]